MFGEEIPGVGQSITPESAGMEVPATPQTPAVEQHATGLKALLARVKAMFSGRGQSSAANTQAEISTGVPSTPIQTEAPTPPAPQTPGLPPTTS